MRICWSQTLMILVVVILGVMSMLGCGQRGPLELPAESAKPTQEQSEGRR